MWQSYREALGIACLLASIFMGGTDAVWARAEQDRDQQEKLYLEAVLSIEDLALAIAGHNRLVAVRTVFFEAGEPEYVDELTASHAQMRHAFERFRTAHHSLFVATDVRVFNDVITRHPANKGFEQKPPKPRLRRLVELFRSVAGSYERLGEDTYSSNVDFWLHEPGNEEKKPSDAERLSLPHERVSLLQLLEMLHFLNHYYEFQEKAQRDTMAVHWKTITIIHEGGELIDIRLAELASRLPNAEFQEGRLHNAFRALYAWQDADEVVRATGLVDVGSTEYLGFQKVIASVSDRMVFSMIESAGRLPCPKPAAENIKCLIAEYLDYFTNVDNDARAWLSFLREHAGLQSTQQRE